MPSCFRKLLTLFQKWKYSLPVHAITSNEQTWGWKLLYRQGACIISNHYREPFHLAACRLQEKRESMRECVLILNTDLWTKRTMWRDLLYPVNSGTSSVVATFSTSQQRWSWVIGSKCKYYCCWHTFPLNITWEGRANKVPQTPQQRGRLPKTAVNHN